MCLWGFFFWKGISSKGIWYLGYLGYDLGSKTRRATSSSPSSISCDIPSSSSENSVALKNLLFGHTRTKESILSTLIFTKRVQPCLWLSLLPTWSSGWSEWLSLVKVVVLIVLACVYVGGCWPSSCAVWFCLSNKRRLGHNTSWIFCGNSNTQTELKHRFLYYPQTIVESPQLCQVQGVFAPTWCFAALLKDQWWCWWPNGGQALPFQTMAHQTIPRHTIPSQTKPNNTILDSSQFIQKEGVKKYIFNGICH